MTVAEIPIDIDEVKLGRAQQLLGAATTEDTVNRALAAVVASYERAEAVRREIERGESGVYNGLLGSLPSGEMPWR